MNKGLLAILVLVIPSGVAQYKKQARFALRWTGSTCVSCSVARNVTNVFFIDSAIGWAVGSNQGPQGAGDYIVLHTADGGHSWREVPETYQHGTPPSFWFLNQKAGWIALWNPADAPKIMRTIDGGQHWAIISNEFAQKIIFFDDRNGYATQDGNRMISQDGGRTWKFSPWHGLSSVDRWFFLTAESGWAAGVQGGGAVVLRTADRGRTWSDSGVTPPSKPSNIEDIFFLDDARGWLITWHPDEEGTFLFSTTDGGKTWAMEPDSTFQGRFKWLTAVRFLSTDLGFAFETVDRERGVGYAGRQSRLLYTLDGGKHWLKQNLEQQISGCQTIERELRCVGTVGRLASPGILTVRSE